MGRRQQQRAAKRKAQEEAGGEGDNILAGGARQNAAKRAGAVYERGLHPRMKVPTTLRPEEWRQAFEIIDDSSVAIKDARLLQIYNDMKAKGDGDLGMAITKFRQELKAGDDQDDKEPEEPKGQCPHQPAERIMLSKEKIRKKNEAPGLRAHEAKRKVEQQARGHRTSSEASETLGLALSSQPRKPKPRSSTDMDEILWSKAREKAEEELASKMQVEGTWKEYYLTMCKVGKCLLAAEVQRKISLSMIIRPLKSSKSCLRKNKTD